jgi:hypothetical protein
LPQGKFEVAFHVEPTKSWANEAISTVIFDVAQDQVRQCELIIDGKAGAERFQSGDIRLRFNNDSAQSKFEFRMFLGNDPVGANIVFSGVTLMQIGVV